MDYGMSSSVRNAAGHCGFQQCSVLWFCASLTHTHTFDWLISVSRLEEKESEMMKEYTKLHDRYTEVCLF